MQSTDRYAFIALLFLVVVVAVAAFWDDGETDVTLADERAERMEEPVLSAQGRPVETGRTADSAPGRGRGAAGGALPISGHDDDVQERSQVTTRGLGLAPHRVDSFGEQQPTIDLDPVGLGRGANIAKGGESTRSPFIDDGRRGGGDAPRRPLTPRRGDLGEQGGVSVADATKGNQATQSSNGESAPKASERKSSDAKKAEPKPSGPASAGPASDGRTYVVKRGDALSSIAQRECGSESLTKDLARLNGLSDPNMIVEGMTLKLLPRSSSKASVATAVVSPAAKTARADGRPVMTLAKGDTLNALLLERYGSWEAPMAHVKRLNVGLDPNKVYAGQILVLPRVDEVEGAQAPADAPRVAQEGGRSTNAASRTKRTGNYVR